MDFNLTDTQRSWQASARAAGRGLPPGTPASDAVAAAAAAGLLDPSAGLLAAAVAVEAMATESPAAAVALALHACAVSAAAGHAAAARLARGEQVAAITLFTEDVPAATDGRMTGRASWVAPITPGGTGIVAVRDGDALLAVSAPLDHPGVAVEPIATAGLDGVAFGHVTFEAVPIAPLGSPLPIMARARILLAAAGLGMGRRALREALNAARVYDRRGAGGEQTVQGLLADAATELDAAMLLTWLAATRDPLSLAQASMAKLAATEATQRAVARATQVVGADTFRRGHVVERLAQDVRALELFAGRTEALREAVAAETLASE